MRPRPFLLLILDGWGYREETEANAIAQAKKPHWDELWKTYAHTLISGSGKCVGLPDGQMGNSEVGHMNIGAGRVIHQDLVRVNLAIENKDFYKNTVLLETLKQTLNNNKAVHILGLLSPGGVHSHETHIQAMIELASTMGIQKIYVHPFLDGRDTPPQSAKKYIKDLMAFCKKFKGAAIASLIGRFYAMDRDNRWERIQKAYELITQGKAEFTASDALTALEMAYERGETDEFVKATRITPAQIEEDDAVIFMNFRADRARELTKTLIDKNFKEFKRSEFKKINFVSLTEYDANFSTPVAFPQTSLKHLLGEHISSLGLSQLRIAETEKYAHVTFFLNGGNETPSPKEDRILIPSPKVATYDLKPEMSALEVTDNLVEQIRSKKYDVIFCNFANPDMLGHTGNFAATVKAIEVIDTCIGRIVAALKEVGGEALITADHGNAELMYDKQTQQPHTAHTLEQVPLLYVGRSAKVIKTNGILADIAPTLLYLMDLKTPSEMTGQKVFELNNN